MVSNSAAWRVLSEKWMCLLLLDMGGSEPALCGEQSPKRARRCPQRPAVVVERAMRLLAALALLAGIGCRTAPRPLPRAPDPAAAAKVAPELPPSQPGRQLALVGDTAVLALSAPQLAELTRE